MIIDSPLNTFEIEFFTNEDKKFSLFVLRCVCLVWSLPEVRIRVSFSYILFVEV